MTEVLLRKGVGGLQAASGDAYRFLGNIARGTEVVADVRDPRRRSGQQHRYWFKLLSVVWDNSEALQKHFGTLEDFRAVLLIRLGYCKVFETKDGTVRVPKSVSFANMEQAEFTQLVDDTLGFFEAELNLDRESLDAEARAA